MLIVTVRGYVEGVTENAFPTEKIIDPMHNTLKRATIKDAARLPS